jgi:uroporphyrinogen decarboxylase
MRQAGRYLPEYRAVRARAGDFLSLCKNKELACEVTLQPLRRFALDAAILFSDILTIPDAMGLGLHFMEGEGPCFKYPVRELSTIEALTVPNPFDELAYVMDAARLIRKEMPSELPLIGFSGSPWTLACYMVEGGASRDFKHILHLMYTQPQALHLLLAKLEAAVIDYLSAQVTAGVNALMIFDTWGGILAPKCYGDFSLYYMTRIVAALKKKHPAVPVILFTKGGGNGLQQMALSGCAALGLDWTVDIGAARKKVGDQVALQGNLDPSVLLTNPECIRREVSQILSSYGKGSGHVFNLGHGITPDVPVDNVSALIDAVAALSPQYHEE